MGSSIGCSSRAKSVVFDGEKVVAAGASDSSGSPVVGASGVAPVKLGGINVEEEAVEVSSWTRGCGNGGRPTCRFRSMCILPLPSAASSPAILAQSPHPLGRHRLMHGLSYTCKTSMEGKRHQSETARARLSTDADGRRTYSLRSFMLDASTGYSASAPGHLGSWACHTAVGHRGKAHRAAPRPDEG